MELDQDLIWLVIRGAVTLAAIGVVIVTAFNLLDRDDPGGIFPANPQSVGEMAVGAVIFAAYAWFLGFGAFAWFWPLPLHPADEEGLGRAGTSVMVGMFGAGFFFHIADRLNRRHWASVGTAEILADMTKHFRELAGPREDVHKKINALIAQIESSQKSYETASERVARERRVKFFKDLKYGLYE